jgi:hypothetical protein
MSQSRTKGSGVARPPLAVIAPESRCRRSHSRPLRCRLLASRVSAIAVVATLSSTLMLAAPMRADVAQAGAPTSEPSQAAAAERLPLQDLLLARGFRVLFGTTVEHIDLEKLRANGIDKLRAKDEAEIRRQLDKIFDDLESVDVKEVLGVSRNSSRDDVIAVVQRVDEASLIAAMDEIPDASIALLIRRKLREKGASSWAEIQSVLETELSDFVDGLSG